MAPATRLQRLQKLVQADINALPDRSVAQPPPQIPASNAADSRGGVALQPEQTDAPPRPHHSKPTRPYHAVRAPNSPLPHPPKNPAMSPPCPPKPTALPPASLQRDQLASARHHFSPIKGLSKYPYRYFEKPIAQDMASAFFDKNKFWEREWDLYYISDLTPDAKPIILIREDQVQALLNEMNTHLQLDLKITDQQREEGFVVQFPDHPLCLPRYLGRSSSRQTYQNSQDSAPTRTVPAPGDPSHPENVPSDTRDMFKQLMENLRDAQKNTRPLVRAKKQQDRLNEQKTMADHFKRTQRYLGLRASIEQGQDSTVPSRAIDVAVPTPFAFDQSVVFVCVDVESYERAHDRITEVGVATLDTRDLIGLAPGADGVDWSKKVRARHFRIDENRHLVNREFVNGYPDKFRFGQSTFVSLSTAAQHVADCFHAPFGAHPSNGAGSAYTLKDEQFDTEEQRNLVFLGHNTITDIQYLHKLGFDISKVANLLEALDTAVMYRVWRREQQSTSLTKILGSFDIDSFYAHNAGNDAVFTVQAMLAICVREATLRGSAQLHGQRIEEEVIRMTAALEASASGERMTSLKMQEDKWIQLESDGDGGCPVPLAASEAPTPSPPQQSSQAAPWSSSSNSTRGHDRSFSRGRGRVRGRGNSDGGRGTTHMQQRGGQSESWKPPRSGQGRGQTDGYVQGGRVRGRASVRSRGRGRGNRGPSQFDPNDAPIQPSTSGQAPRHEYPDLL